MRRFALTWLCALTLAVWTLFIYPKGWMLGLVTGWLILLGLGTITRDFRAFAAAGVVVFIGCILIAFVSSVITDYGALAIGLLLFLMLESSYLACLISQAEKTKWSNVEYEVADRAKDWKRWYSSLGKRTLVLAGLGLVLVSLLHAASLALIPDEWFFPMLLIAAVSLGVFMYRVATRRS